MRFDGLNPPPTAFYQGLTVFAYFIPGTKHLFGSRGHHCVANEIMLIATHPNVIYPLFSTFKFANIGASLKYISGESDNRWTYLAVFWPKHLNCPIYTNITCTWVKNIDLLEFKPWPCCIHGDVANDLSLHLERVIHALPPTYPVSLSKLCCLWWQISITWGNSSSQLLHN